MRIYYGSEGLKIPPSVVALGDFDAIHRGHKAIIESTVNYAKEQGVLSIVYMFSSLSSKGTLRINTLDKRLEILEEMGIDIAVVEDFTAEYQNTSCEEFVKEYLVKRLNVRAVFAGFNYRFGKGAKGDAVLLKRLCDGIEVFILPCVKLDNIPVSSSTIKKMIEEGQADKAAKFMGRYFSVSGEVVKGKQLGRTIGFPTANIMYPKETVIPMEGVYITQSKIGNNKYYSITNVGKKPTVMDNIPNIETAIGDFSEDIYGKTIEIEFCRFIRKTEKFDSLDALKNQLKLDMETAKKFYSEQDEAIKEKCKTKERYKND